MNWTNTHYFLALVWVLWCQQQRSCATARLGPFLGLLPFLTTNREPVFEENGLYIKTNGRVFITARSINTKQYGSSQPHLRDISGGEGREWGKCVFGHEICRRPAGRPKVASANRAYSKYRCRKGYRGMAVLPSVPSLLWAMLMRRELVVSPDMSRFKWVLPSSGSG